MSTLLATAKLTQSDTPSLIAFYSEVSINLEAETVSLLLTAYTFRTGQGKSH
jgi:hypothetical protein